MLAMIALITSAPLLLLWCCSASVVVASTTSALWTSEFGESPYSRIPSSQQQSLLQRLFSGTAADTEAVKKAQLAEDRLVMQAFLSKGMNELAKAVPRITTNRLLAFLSSLSPSTTVPYALVQAMADMAAVATSMGAESTYHRRISAMGREHVVEFCKKAVYDDCTNVNHVLSVMQLTQKELADILYDPLVLTLSMDSNGALHAAAVAYAHTAKDTASAFALLDQAEEMSYWQLYIRIAYSHNLGAYIRKLNSGDHWLAETLAAMDAAWLSLEMRREHAANLLHAGFDKLARVVYRKLLIDSPPKRRLRHVQAAVAEGMAELLLDTAVTAALGGPERVAFMLVLLDTKTAVGAHRLVIQKTLRSLRRIHGAALDVAGAIIDDFYDIDHPFIERRKRNN